jgi:tetratricopeptide (TPR) repeat protein
MALASRNLPEALEELEYATHVEPKLAGIQSLLGATLMRLRQWEAAETAFQRAVEQDPADAQALDGLAAVALERKNFEDAAHWALEALEQNMQLFRAHWHLGIALAHLNRTEAAIAALTTCARLDPTRAAPLDWLSRIANDQLGDTVLAQRYRDQARNVVRQRRSKTEA